MDELDNSFSFLTDNEKKIFNDILEKAKQRQLKYEPKQIRSIVPIDKWINSPYYLGSLHEQIYPYWKDKMIKIFKDPFRYNEIIFTGGIGTGKSTMALIGMVRQLYELSCWQNLPARFNFMPGSMISMIYFSISKEQAELTGFGQLRSLIDSIPYFRSKFPRYDKIDSMLVWDEVVITFGSRSSHALGMNVISSILDEANFYQGETNTQSSLDPSFSRVARMYQQLISRGQSRFLIKGVNYSKNFLVSSSTHTSSFTQTRIENSVEDPSVFVVSSKLWEVKPEGTYSNEKFIVFKGSETLDPKIVDTKNDLKDILINLGYLELYDDSVSMKECIENLPDYLQDRFIFVPIDFRKSFDFNVIYALQDLGGESVAPIGRLFSSKLAYNKCAILKYYPFTKDTFEISTNTTVRIQDYLKSDYKYLLQSSGTLRYKRFIHIDQSVVSDNTGITCLYMNSDENVIVDFMLRITPPSKPHELDIMKIVDFIIYLRDVLGMDIASVSFDQYQSRASMQQLAKYGFNVKYTSVDRDDEAYLSLVDFIFFNKIFFYDYKYFSDELFSLIHYRSKKKVDHPLSSSKDVSDSVAGALFDLIQYKDYNLKKGLGYNQDYQDDLKVISEANRSYRSDLEEFRNEILSGL